MDIGPLVWIVFFGTLFFVIVLGSILSYHWLKYAMNPIVSTIAIGVYTASSAVLLFALFGAAVAISL